MYRYETHLHTFPVSKCARVGVRESLEYYKELGYDGVFVTNHFIDGNINIEPDRPYEEKINFYFSDYEDAKKVGDEIGLKVFLGIESSYHGTDFLVYGLDKAWFLDHPECDGMDIKALLALFRESGAVVIHAHPFREADYIGHIRLFPDSVDGVEIINACRTDFENKMAGLYAENYGFLTFAGSDNHRAGGQKKLAGVCSDIPIVDEADFVKRVKNGEMKVFTFEQE